MDTTRFCFTLPWWMDDFLAQAPASYPDPQARMGLVIALSRENVRQASGGPFAAAIFDLKRQSLVSVGVNQVMAANCSVLHAEMVAIMLAQQALGTFDLGAEGLPEYELAASTEPCAMCFGAIPWSGVCSLICGARDEDARAIGFDEGPKLPDWPRALTSRGIRVQRDILRQQAGSVLRFYQESGGIIYNGRGRLR